MRLKERTIVSESIPLNDQWLHLQEVLSAQKKCNKVLLNIKYFEVEVHKDQCVCFLINDTTMSEIIFSLYSNNKN